MSHSFLQPVYDFGQQDSLTYIVMQYVKASTLKDVLDEPLDLKLAVGIIDQVADALPLTTPTSRGSSTGT